MNNRATYFNMYFKGVDDIRPLVRNWAEILYHEKRHESEHDGIDFNTDLDLVKKYSNSKEVIITKWGKPEESCFYCITGYALYDILPWWKEMQEFFEKDLKLHPWLPFPCILISMSNLRRHSDIGRPTAFNYGIFGEEVTTNYLWYDSKLPDNKYSESYVYKQGRSILMDTSIDHGGIVNPGYSESDLRAICNMGFVETYDVCLKKINESFSNNTISKIL